MISGIGGETSLTNSQTLNGYGIWISLIVIQIRITIAFSGPFLVTELAMWDEPKVKLKCLICSLSRYHKRC